MNTAIIIVIGLILYAVFYMTHGKYLEKKVVRVDPNRQTPAQKLYDGVDYVPANKYVLYGHHFASIAGAGPIVGPAIAMAWGWLPTLLWVWFGNVFVGVVHDYLALMSSVRYDGHTIAWISGKLMSRRAFYAFNTYIWFALVLVVAAFAFVISALFTKVPGAGFASFVMILLAPLIGYLMYKSPLGFKGGTIVGLILIALSIYGGYVVQSMGFSLSFNTWLVILLIYIIIAASLPVWVLLQPRDYMNAYILWFSLALGGSALIVVAAKGLGALQFPAFTTFSANVVGGQPSPFWPTIPLIVACGALSGFHSIVGSGTSSKQLANEAHGLLVGYGGMLTEGFLSTLVIGSLAAFGFLAFQKAGLDATTLQQLHNPLVFGAKYAIIASKLKWAVIPYSYAYAVKGAYGLPFDPVAIFATLWITAFALTSLDTATRLGRYAWQELMEPLKKSAEGAYKFLANRWFASALIAIIGVLLAYTKQFLIIWPAFAGMNQLLASLALMTIAIWVIKIQKAKGLGKGLTVAPAIFLWVTLTLALLWYLIVVIPVLWSKSIVTAATVGAITIIGIALNIYLFIEWILALTRKEPGT